MFTEPDITSSTHRKCNKRNESNMSTYANTTLEICNMQYTIYKIISKILHTVYRMWIWIILSVIIISITIYYNYFYMIRSIEKECVDSFGFTPTSIQLRSALAKFKPLVTSGTDCDKIVSQQVGIVDMRGNVVETVTVL